MDKQETINTKRKKINKKKLFSTIDDKDTNKQNPIDDNKSNKSKEEQIDENDKKTSKWSYLEVK